jgi:hypothetical protein
VSDFANVIVWYGPLETKEEIPNICTPEDGETVIIPFPNCIIVIVDPIGITASEFCAIVTETLSSLVNFKRFPASDD